MNQQDVFASAQIVVFNPILKESLDTRLQYFVYLRRLIRFVKWDKRKYTRAQIDFYKQALCGEEDVTNYRHDIEFDRKYCFLLPYDLTLMLGFQAKAIQPEKVTGIINKIVSDFDLTEEQAGFLGLEFGAAMGDDLAWEQVETSQFAKGLKKYVKIARQNIDFIRSTPLRILITANMSAGKSTLINALVGKKISLVQTMACTSKIHTIISKPFEDGVSSEYDYDLSLSASLEDLMNDNEENQSSRITVGTYFNGELSGKRLILLDSPGVNASEHPEHREITEKMIRSRKYKVLIDVLNSTNLSSNDEKKHLENIRKWIGRSTVVFVLNQADKLIDEGEDYLKTIEDQRVYLTSLGFKHPIICPVSSRAAYLAKKSLTRGLSRLEQREINTFKDIFEIQSMSVYYEKQFGLPHMNSKCDEKTLLHNCGFTYLEKIITHVVNGGKIYDTGLC